MSWVRDCLRSSVSHSIWQDSSKSENCIDESESKIRQESGLPYKLAGNGPQKSAELPYSQMKMEKQLPVNFTVIAS